MISASAKAFVLSIGWALFGLLMCALVNDERRRINGFWQGMRNRGESWPALHPGWGPIPPARDLRMWPLWSAAILGPLLLFADLLGVLDWDR